MITKITKLETGKVQFLNASDDILVSLLPFATIEAVGTTALQITDSTGTAVVITAADITTLTVLPAAPVVGTWDAQALWGELITGFFR